MESLLFNLVRPLLNSEHDQRMAESTLLFLPVVTPRQFQSMYKIKDPLASPPPPFFILHVYRFPWKFRHTGASFKN